MKFNIKNLLVLGLCCILILVGNNAYIYAKYTSYYTHVVERQSLGAGIDYQKVKMATNRGWIQYIVVKANLKNNNIKLKGIYSPKGMSNRANVKEMTNGDENIVAAVNGDFFNMNQICDSIGALGTDKRLLSTPNNTLHYATFYITLDNILHVDYLANNVTIMAPNGKSQKLFAINKKYRGYNDIDMFTKEWGRKSPGAPVEMLVKNGVVKSIKYNGNTGKSGNENKGINIDDSNTTVFASNYYKNNFLMSNFKIGDAVNMNYDLGNNISGDKLKIALGGKNMLLKDGKITKEAWNDSYKINPQTAIGFNKRGDFIMLTVDGRESAQNGVSMSELAQMLKEYGATDGMSLDGGGSTTMLAKLPGYKSAELVNKPSDGAMRKVADGLGIYIDSKPGRPSNLLLNTEDKNVFNNSRRYIDVTAMDKNNKIVSIDTKKLNWKIEGVKGKMSGNYFMPMTSGNAILTAQYENITQKIHIRVLGRAFELKLSKDYIDANTDNNKTLSVKGIDKDGIESYIDNNDVDWKIDTNYGTIKNGCFNKNVDFDYNNKATIVGVKFDSAVKYLVLGNKNATKQTGIKVPKSSVFYDEQKGIAKIKNKSTDYAMSLINNWNSFSKADSIRINNSSDNVLTFDWPPKKISSQLKENILYNKNSMSTQYKNSLILRIVADKHGITSCAHNQWKYIEQQLDSNTKDNVFVTINEPLSISTFNSDDRQNLIDMLLEYKSKTGKNLYMIQFKAWKTADYVKDGIRYITVNNKGSHDVPVIYVTAQGVSHTVLK